MAGESRDQDGCGPLSLAHAASIAAVWSLVHGFTLLLLDGRPANLLERMPPGNDETDLFRVIFGGMRQPPR